MAYQIKKRTFEAKKFPAGSTERLKFNETVLTSEYYPSKKYALFYTFELHNGSVLIFNHIYATKLEATNDAKMNYGQETVFTEQQLLSGI